MKLKIKLTFCGGFYTVYQLQTYIATTPNFKNHLSSIHTKIILLLLFISYFVLFAVQIDISLVIVSNILLHNIQVTSILCMRKLPSLQLVAINLRVIDNITLTDIVLTTEKVTFH